jgi:hypothetical protein
LLIIIIGFPFISEGQILNRIRRAAEEGIGKAVEKRVEKEVEKATQRQLEKAFSNLYGPEYGDSSGNYNFAKILKGVNMNVPTEDSYEFTGHAEMEITGTDENGKPIDPVKMKTFLNNSDQYTGMEFSAEDQEQNDQLEKTIMIFDMKNNASIILVENDSEKSRMAYGLNWQGLYEIGEQNDTLQHNDTLELNEEDFTFQKTGNTKTIAGHLCEEYLGETEEYKGAYWITQEPIEGINTFWSKNSTFLNQKMKNQDGGYFDSMPDGNILEINHQSKTDQSSMQMVMVNIDENNAISFEMADYPNMMQTAEAEK